MNRVFRYPPRGLIGDYVRAGLGVAFSSGLSLAVPLTSPAQYVLIPLALLFAVFAARTGRRHISRVELSTASVSLFQPGQVSLETDKVRVVKLSYFSTKTDRAGGWMQLTMKGTGGPSGGTIRLDSGLEGFVDVVRWAVAAARVNRLDLSKATIANLGSLGIDAGRPE